MTEPYVPGLDLATGLAVDAGSADLGVAGEGHNGDGTLVCLECDQESGGAGGRFDRGDAVSASV